MPETIHWTSGIVEAEYRTVMGYHYAHGAFYVLFSEGNMVHMNQLDKLVVSVKIKKEETRWMRQKK